MKTLTVYLFLISNVLLASLCASAQGQIKRKLTLSQLIEEMVNTKDTIYWIDNAAIYADDKTNRESKYFRDGSYSFKINKPVFFINCIFSGNTNEMSGHYDEFEASFNKCSWDDLTFVDCKLDNANLFFWNCEFNGNFELNGSSKLNNLQFGNSIIRNAIRIQHNIERLGIGKCKFIADTTNSRFDTSVPSYYDSQLQIFHADYGRVTISDTEFNLNDLKKVYSITLNGSTINTLNILNTKLEAIDLSNLTVINSILIDSSEFSKTVVVDNVTLPEGNTNVSWKFFSGNKLGLYPQSAPYTKAFQGNITQELANETALNDLISSYNKFYSIYKTRGDRKSANGVYEEMKGLETRKLKYDYDQNKTMAGWFNWKLNKFLEVFCDYGTNPVKSLIISIYTILGFALLYFFFYSEWDKINQSFLIGQHRKLMRYFRSEQNIEDFYLEYYKADLQEYAQYQEELEESKSDMPYFLHLLGKPLYQVSLKRYRFMVWLYKKSEILHGRWVDLKPGRKLVVAGFAGAAVTFYALYLVSVRALNSIFLSVNTFSTLGFGDIPVTGISRYVAILEGFLGWFLLSIFSVSLISQIIQI